MNMDTEKNRGRLSPRNARPHRFAFWCDTHIVDRVSACQQRLFEWARRRTSEYGADTLVLGGDMTHHADVGPAAYFVKLVNGIAGSTLYLPGNNETTAIAPDQHDPRVHFVRKAVRLAHWPGHVFALPTTNRTDATAAVTALLAMLPQQGAVLVLAHFPPEQCGADAVAQLRQTNLAIDWVCGHRHQRKEHAHGTLRVHQCGGLDPVKVRGHLPELLVGEWDGASLRVVRLQASDTVLLPPERKRFTLGLAYREDAANHLITALDHGVGAIQFHYLYSSGKPSRSERDLIERFRGETKDSFLSLHLPNFKHPGEGLDTADMAPFLEWAEAAGVDDCTVHTPKVMTRQLYQGEGVFADSEWAARCLEAYTELARCIVGVGARLSIENLYAKDAPEDELDELLSIRPWHLIHLVKAIRSKLVAAGFKPGEAEKVGVILDSGHAFRGAKVNKIHGLADWMDCLGPYLQLAHIHQVLQVDGQTRNHTGIADLYGPLINYHGFLDVLAESVPKPFPLLLEVREREQALLSLATLRLHPCVER